MRVLVAGATGRVGSSAVRHLLEHGHEAVALVRNERKARMLRELGARVRVGDVRDPNSLVAAVASCDAVFSALAGGRGRGSFEEVEYRGNLALLFAARRAGATRFIYNSALRVDHPLARDIAPFRAKWEFEQALLETVDTSPTVLRPSMFMESLLLALRGNRAFIMGAQRRAVNWISADDVGRAAVAAAERNVTGVQEIAGPDRMTWDEAYGVLGRVWGREIKVTHLPLGGLRAVGRVTPALGELSGMFRLFEEAGYEADPAPLRDTFGVEAATLPQWAADRASLR